jgi:predicted anti-sigma-YlaC factor YlaD
VVELVTRSDDVALDVDDRRRFDEHLASCDACVTYYDQLRQIARLAGALDDDAPVDPAVEAALLSAFRAAADGR